MKKQDWITSITDVEAVTDTQEPYLLLRINGRWARIPERQTFTAIKNGCVSVAGDLGKVEPKDRFYFNKVMPEIELILEEEEGTERITTLAGCTNDSRIVQLWIDNFGDGLYWEVREGLTKLGYKLPSP